MSLEQELSGHAAALAANTAALQALTAALAAHPIPAPSSAPFTAAVAPVPTALAEQPAFSLPPTTAFAQPAQIALPPVTTAAPLTAPPAVAGDLDSKGMPWDGRIHASTKAKVADGSWRYKRGCDEAVITQVEAELRAALMAPAAPVGGVGTPWPFPAEPVVVAPPPVPPAAAVIPAPPVMVAPPPVAPVAVPVPVPAGTGMTYEALMAALPPKIVAGEITATSLQQACETFGIPSIASLQTRPDLVQSIAATLGL